MAAFSIPEDKLCDSQNNSILQFPPNCGLLLFESRVRTCVDTTGGFSTDFWVIEMAKYLTLQKEGFVAGLLNRYGQ